MNALRGRSGAETAGDQATAWVAVDLEALGHNYRRLRRRVEPAEVLAVVKANAYGHGAVPVARALERLGVDWLGVGNVVEGEELRRGGVATPILVMGITEASRLDRCRELALTPVLSSREQIASWSEASAGRPLDVHLKVDTGMSRLGVPLAEAGPALEELRRGPLRMTGLLSHFAEADRPESPRNRRQAERFEGLAELLESSERRTVLRHQANSAGALHLPASRHDLVRLGLSLYGLDPAGREPGLRPVMSVAARVALVRDVETGARVGYGGTWRARRPSRLAVVTLGYGDGYPWRLSNRAEALIRGRRVPVAGRVSMDMTVLDVTDTGAETGDEVVLLGRQGDQEITALELAERAGTIPWEILCQFGLRLPSRHAPPPATTRASDR